jgi:L-ascorbate metabolism protein UlaG (beta-lactamase superfamily)
VIDPEFSVEGVLAEHDMDRGARFGWVTLFTWTMDGFRIAFLSDLGHALTARQTDALGRVDILLIPVGGHYTLDAPSAAGVVGQIPGARLVLPMHYQTPMLNREQFPIAGVEPFTERFSSVHKERSGRLELSRLPAAQEITVLSPTC